MTNNVNESCYKPSKLSEGGKKEKNQILDDFVTAAIQQPRLPRLGLSNEKAETLASTIVRGVCDGWECALQIPAGPPILAPKNGLTQFLIREESVISLTRRSKITWPRLW